MMKFKGLYFIILVALLAFSMALISFSADIAVEANDGRVFESYSDTIFYLPSYISPQSVKLIHDGTKSLSYYDASGERIALENGAVIDLTQFMITMPNGVVKYSLDLIVESSSKTISFYIASNLPSIHVNTSIGVNTIVSTNGKDTESQIAIINKDGTYEYTDTDLTNSEIKVRGNTTKDYAKKPFQIKLGSKDDLFGMGKAKTWILLANYLDQSQLRNSVMYQIGSLLGMHTSQFKSVDLFIDGQYYGIYLLCEKVQIQSNRLDIIDLEKLTDELNPTYSQAPVIVTSGSLIDETIITQYSYIPDVVNPTDITGGYLVELDNNYWRNELCYFVTENDNHYVIKSPEYASKEQVEYIARLFADMEEALMSSTGYNSKGIHYSEYMDVDSFVYGYIVAELSRNYDAGSSSMYFYKDADVNGVTSKIYKGPLWDCDNTLGNIHKNGASATEGYWARGRRLWEGLTQHSDFNEQVTNELARVYDQIFDMIDAGGFIYQQVEEIGTSIIMERGRWRSDNYSYWPLYFDGTHYDRWQSSPVFNFVSGKYSYDMDKDNTTVIGYLCEHIEGRLNWLANEWDCNVTIRERSFEIKDDTDDKDDSTVDSNPVPPPEIPDSIPDSTPDSIPDSTPDSIPDSTPDSIPDSTPDSIPDSTPDVIPDSDLDSTLDSVIDSTVDSVIDSKVDSIPNSAPNADTIVSDSNIDSSSTLPDSTVDSTTNGDSDNKDNTETIVAIAIISVSVVAIGGTAIALGIKSSKKD